MAPYSAGNTNLEKAMIAFDKKRYIAMWAVFIILSIAGIYKTDSIQSFHQHSNHNPVYEFVHAAPCENGLRSSGYSVVPTGRLFLKQVNKDGTVGAVCSD